MWDANSKLHGVLNTILSGIRVVKAFVRAAHEVQRFGVANDRLIARIDEGEFLAVMGPSGCGKSTLLHLLGLMTPPDAGTVAFDGAAAPSSAWGRTAIRRDRIGFIFQRFNLIGVLSYARLGRSQLPLGYDRRFSQDSFGLFVACRPERMAEARAILSRARAEEIREV